MPDGDVVHNKLGKLYQEPYKWLCEGKAAIDDYSSQILLSQVDTHQVSNEYLVAAQ